MMYSSIAQIGQQTVLDLVNNNCLQTRGLQIIQTVKGNCSEHFITCIQQFSSTEMECKLCNLHMTTFIFSS